MRKCPRGEKESGKEVRRDREYNKMKTKKNKKLNRIKKNKEEKYNKM